MMEQEMNLIIDMNAHLPGELTMEDVQTIVRGRNLKVCFYMTDTLMNADIVDLEMSVRATNALKRAGFHKVRDIINLDDLPGTLEKIRNCGAKSRTEIMGKLLFFQYSLIPGERRTVYMRRLLELNEII